MPDWLSNELSSPSELLLVAATGLLVYLSVIAVVRLNGLRSFSTMSAFDFAMTVAVGTLVSSTMISKSVGLMQGLVGLLTLFVAQRVISFTRRRLQSFKHAIDNDPLLLMDGETVLTENLDAARITEDDLRAKIREANVTSLSEIRAVVLESTGDVSVITADDGTARIEPWIMQDVRGVEPRHAVRGPERESAAKATI